MSQPEPIPITINGGGLAGLALGIALRERGVPVTLLEAGRYPRHRVCGEFICGVGQATLETLGISAALEPKVMNRDSRWFYRGRPILKKKLPLPAIGISRHHLDAWLADEFVRLGGDLQTFTRADVTEIATPATVWTTGRQRTLGGEWLGLKCHVRGLRQSLDTDLQMHFGEKCYVGLSQVEDDVVNVCGIFKKHSDLKADGRLGLLGTYLRADGLQRLAEQIEAAEIDPASVLGVSAFQLGRQAAATADHDDGERLLLGDAWSMIPPFTGNGMTMAFQSAETALDPLLDYAHQKSTWPVAVARIRSGLHRRFDRRLRWAMAIHPFLLHPAGQRTFLTLAKLRALPFGLLFKQTR